VDLEPTAPRASPGPDQDLRALLYTGLSLVLHVGLLGLSAAFIPALGEGEAGAAAESETYLMAHAVGDLAEREEEEAPVTTLAESDPDGREPVPSRCGELRGGSMGEPTARVQQLRYGVEGPPDNPDPHFSWRAPGGEHAVHFPAIALARDGEGGPRAPAARWGRYDALANDPSHARGNEWGDGIGDAHGSPGIGIGRHELCETCGDTGSGGAPHPAKAPDPEDAPPAGCLGLLLLTD
jgi:hypothetical protein